MGPKAAPPEPARSFSTTGRPLGPDGSGAPARARGKAKAKETAPVQLVRLPGKQVQRLPERLFLGGSMPSAVTVGRHEENDAVLPLSAASKVHCQVALRAFRLPSQDGGVAEDIHEAAFLRDNSRNGTLVNGLPAFRPWHWLQNGDILGLKDATVPDGMVNFYRVEYSAHRALPGHLVTPEDLPRKADPAARRPGQKPPAAVYGAEIIGQVVDVRYTDQVPHTVYRMRVTKFEPSTGWHKCDSKGLSLWDGDSFVDTINLNQMFLNGNVKFVDEADLAGEDEEEDEDDDQPLKRPPPKKRRARAP